MIRGKILKWISNKCGCAAGDGEPSSVIPDADGSSVLNPPSPPYLKSRKSRSMGGKQSSRRSSSSWPVEASNCSNETNESFLSVKSIHDRDDNFVIGVVESPSQLNFSNIHASFLASMLTSRFHNPDASSQPLYSLFDSHRLSLYGNEYVAMCAYFILSTLRVYGTCVPKDGRVINKQSRLMYSVLNDLHSLLTKMKGNQWHPDNISTWNNSCFNCEMKEVVFKQLSFDETCVKEQFCLVCLEFVSQQKWSTHNVSDHHKTIKNQLFREIYPHSCLKCHLKFCYEKQLQDHMSSPCMHMTANNGCQEFNPFACYLCLIPFGNDRDLAKHCNTLEHGCRKEMAMELALRHKRASEINPNSDIEAHSECSQKLTVNEGFQEIPKSKEEKPEPNASDTISSIPSGQYHCEPCSANVPKANVVDHEKGLKHQKMCQTWVSSFRKSKQQSVSEATSLFGVPNTSQSLGSSLVVESNSKFHKDSCIFKKESHLSLPEIANKSLELKNDDWYGISEMSASQTIHGFEVIEQEQRTRSYDLTAVKNKEELKFVADGERTLFLENAVFEDSDSLTSSSYQEITLTPQKINLADEACNKELKNNKLWVRDEVLHLERDFVKKIDKTLWCSLCETGFCEGGTGILHHLLSKKHLTSDWVKGSQVQEKLIKLISLQSHNVLQPNFRSAIKRIKLLIKQQEAVQTLSSKESAAKNICFEDIAQTSSQDESILENTVFIGDDTTCTLQEQFYKEFGNEECSDFSIECGICGAPFTIFNEDIDFSLDLHIQSDPKHALAIAVPVERNAMLISEISKTSKPKDSKMVDGKSSGCKVKKIPNIDKAMVIKEVLSLEKKYVDTKNGKYFCTICSVNENSDCQIVHHLLLKHLSRQWADDHSYEELLQKLKKLESLSISKYASHAISSAIFTISAHVQRKKPQVNVQTRVFEPSKASKSKVVPKTQQIPSTSGASIPNVRTKPCKASKSVDVPETKNQQDLSIICKVCLINYSALSKNSKRKHNATCTKPKTKPYRCKICKQSMHPNNKETHEAGSSHKRMATELGMLP